MSVGGLEKLRQQVLECVSEQIDTFHDEAVGDSPIERLFITALESIVLAGLVEYRFVRFPSAHWSISELLAQRDQLSLIVEPQAKVSGWRVDFLIYAWDTGRATGREQWRRLIVECDGHDFHERTKAQAICDRSRDRAAQLEGVTVLRFTGSEIHNDPMECAMQVVEWGVKGWQ